MKKQHSDEILIRTCIANKETIGRSSPLGMVLKSQSHIVCLFVFSAPRIKFVPMMFLVKPLVHTVVNTGV